jgi:hypothetical protein
MDVVFHVLRNCWWTLGVVAAIALDGQLGLQRREGAFIALIVTVMLFSEDRAWGESRWVRMACQ